MGEKNVYKMQKANDMEEMARIISNVVERKISPEDIQTGVRKCIYYVDLNRLGLEGILFCTVSNKRKLWKLETFCKVEIMK